MFQVFLPEEVTVAEQSAVSFGGLLRRLRTAAGMTQEELAEAASVSARTISDLERGVNHTARKDTARLLADALGLAGIAWTEFEAAARGRAVPDQPFAAAGLAAVGGLPVTAPLGRLPADVRGRDALLAELRAALTRRRVSRRRRNGGVWVLAGLGGLGKSTSALAAAEVAVARGWRVWWVTATDRASLNGGMIEVLRQLDAPESVIRLVQEGSPIAADRVWEFLDGRHAAGRRWLLVFDNADDPAVLAADGVSSPADHAGWLRPDPSGVVVVTTRNKSPQAWGPGVAWRELAPLEEADAAQVLADLCPGMTDPGGDQARALGRRLGGLPLALHLAGAYLASPFARWHTFGDYRQALDSVELPAALADLDDPGAQARATIQRTWDLSLDALATGGRPQARPLLLMLSCYATVTPIPAGLLQAQLLAGLLGTNEVPAAGANGGMDAVLQRRLRDGLHGLAVAGLIDITDRGSDTGGPMVTVHPVVADANRSRLLTSARSDLALIGTVAVLLVHSAAGQASSTQPASWAAWRSLAPHLAALLGWLAGYLDGETLVTLLDASDHASDALRNSGNPGAAEALARSSIASATRLGNDHVGGLAARLRLAQAIGDQGRNHDAELIYRPLLADQQRLLSADHPETFTTRLGLAWMLECQGRYGEASQVYQQLVTDQQRTLGSLHPDTLTTRNSIARMTGLAGHPAEAEQLARLILADRTSVLGQDDPATLATRHNLGWMIWRQGRYDEAAILLGQVLADRERILGDQHPATLTTRLRLVRVLADQGMLDKAERLCRRVLADRQRILGEDHPSTLTARSVLARITGMQGRYAEAEQVSLQLLADRRRIMRDDHPDGLITRHNLAWLIELQGRYDEAERLCCQVLTDRERILGDSHPDTLNSRFRLAHIVADQGRNAEARQLMTHVLADRQRILGDNHPDTLTAARDLEQFTQKCIGTTNTTLP